MGGNDPEIGRQQNLRAAADGEAVYRGNHRDVQRLEASEDRAGKPHDLA